MDHSHSDSYDLVTRVKAYGIDEARWYWQGEPMRTLDSVQRRAKRLKKRFGDRWLGDRIILTRLDQVSGEVVMSIVELSEVPDEKEQP